MAEKKISNRAIKVLGIYEIVGGVIGVVVLGVFLSSFIRFDDGCSSTPTGYGYISNQKHNTGVFCFIVYWAVWIFDSCRISTL